MHGHTAWGNTQSCNFTDQVWPQAIHAVQAGALDQPNLAAELNVDQPNLAAELNVDQPNLAAELNVDQPNLSTYQPS